MADLFCPTFVQTGDCPNQYCPFNHTNCLVCQKSGLSRKDLYSHIRGKKHAARLRQFQSSVSWHCPVCNVTMAIEDRTRHESDISHTSRLAGLSVRHPAERQTYRGQDPEFEPRLNAGLGSQKVYSTDWSNAFRGPGVRCGLCKRAFAWQEWSQHLSDPGHARKARLATYQQALQEGTRDRLGVSIITGDLDFGLVELDSLADWPTREDSFYVQVEEEGYWITNIQMTSSLSSSAEFRDTR